MKYLLILLLFLITTTGYSQTTRKKSEKVIEDVQENYSVLVDSPSVRHGLYQAIYRKKTAIASGRYDRGKRVGVWHFYSKKGVLLQNYDYDKHAITFSSPVDTMRAVRYVIDDEIKPNDAISAPIKPGSVYFGYLAYVSQITVPQKIGEEVDLANLSAIVELLVSPGGRLADFKIRVISPSGYINKVAEMPLSSLTDEDRVFLPASKNGESVGMTVIITCRFDRRGRVYF